MDVWFARPAPRVSTGDACERCELVPHADKAALDRTLAAASADGWTVLSRRHSSEDGHTAVLVRPRR